MASAGLDDHLRVGRTVVTTLSELLAGHTDLPGAAVDHLQRIVGDWQLAADLSFADLLLWVGTDELGVDGTGAPVLCVAQCRPTTAPTVLPVDRVGAVAGQPGHGHVVRALVERRVVVHESGESDSTGLISEAIPLWWQGHVIAVLTRDREREPHRGASRLEAAYRECANVLCQMISESIYPTAEEVAGVNSSPRAGDGFIRLAVDGTVTYASPNAQSAYHRMGLNTDLLGMELSSLTGKLVSDTFDAREIADHLGAVAAGERGRRIEVDARGATIVMRTIALKHKGTPMGAAVLVRDVTEVKRRDRALLSKDATIREIHHRVKNNLQTVAALLRLQARRTDNVEARHALSESVRRVTSIALVHDLLSMSVDEEVDLDEVMDKLLPMVTDLAALSGRIDVHRAGAIGVFPAERATPLAMVVAELVQNAIEHGFDGATTGTITVDARRSSRLLEVVVSDSGRGLPDGFDLAASDRLGLQIVRTLVDVELGGSLEIVPGRDGGTDAIVHIPLGRRAVRG